MGEGWDRGGEEVGGGGGCGIEVEGRWVEGVGVGQKWRGGGWREGEEERVDVLKYSCCVRSAL